MSVAEPQSVGEPAAPSQQSLLTLSWLSFFLSGMQTAFGPIAAAYLAIQKWTAKDIGFALTIGGTARLVSQVPGSGLVDAMRAKRLLVATGVVTVVSSVLIFRLWPNFPLVALAEVLQGITGGRTWTRGRCYYPRIGRPRPVVGTAWTEPAVRGCRRRRGYAEHGRHHIFRLTPGNVRSRRTCPSGARFAESDSRRRN